MPEYVLGGAETQIRYFIEFAETQKWKLDVLIEHELAKDDMALKEAMTEMKIVRFYELDGGREYGKLYFSIISHVLKHMWHTRYTTCLIYYLPDLELAPFMQGLRIHVVYSERIDAAGIRANPHFQRCLKFCDYIFANSRYAQEELEKLTGKRVGMIRNGKPAVPQLPMKEDRKIRRILVPARISPDKNQLLLLYYLKKYPDFERKVVFAGFELDKTYLNKIKQFVNRNGLCNRVEILGYVADMKSEYEKADIIVLPSFAEGTPNVVLEAYAYGRPVIVSDISAEHELVANSKLRFGIKSPEEIEECIKYVESLSEYSYKQMLKKNRRIVLRDYNIEKMAKSFYKVLSK